MLKLRILTALALVIPLLVSLAVDSRLPFALLTLLNVPADTALAAVLNHGRFDVGWYTGRVYGLLANGFVLGVLLLESGSLYARLGFREVYAYWYRVRP